MERKYNIECVYDFSNSENTTKSSKLIEILMRENAPFCCRPLYKDIEIAPYIRTKDSIYYSEYLDNAIFISNLRTEIMKEQTCLESNSREVFVK